MKTVAIRTLLTASIVALPLPGATRNLVDARVFPAAAPAPCDVVIEASIEPDAHNLSVEFTIESGTFFSSSTAGLDGDRAPRKKDVTFRRLPAGAYRVHVTLVRDDGRRAAAVRYVSLW